MPLPALIRAALKSINPKTIQKNNYFGVYNILLWETFPVTDGYVVYPQIAPIVFGRALEPVTYFRVDLCVDSRRIPVLFIEIKTAIAITGVSARAAADDQMRLRISQLFEQSPTVLHGISAFGPKLCFYRLDKTVGSITPLPILEPATYADGLATVDRWDVDISTDDGYDRFMSIVADVKASAATELANH